MDYPLHYNKHLEEHSEDDPWMAAHYHYAPLTSNNVADNLVTARNLKSIAIFMDDASGVTRPNLVNMPSTLGIISSVGSNLRHNCDCRYRGRGENASGLCEGGFICHVRSCVRIITPSKSFC